MTCHSGFNVAASFLKESERATSDCLFQFLDSSGDGRILFEDLRAFSWAVCCCLVPTSGRRFLWQTNTTDAQSIHAVDFCPSGDEWRGCTPTD